MIKVLSIPEKNQEKHIPFYYFFNSLIKFNLSILLCFLLLPTMVQAHRVADNVIDDCRIRVGYEAVHFTAYTPRLSGAEEYCNAIPELGLTNLVFDYEGKKLRKLTVEFEITKEPEGTRIFYQEPQIIKSGNVNGIVDFSEYGAGNYLAHVSIVHKDKKLDSHMPFTVGISKKSNTLLIPLSILFAILFIVLYIMKRKSDQIEPKEE